MVKIPFHAIDPCICRLEYKYSAVPVIFKLLRSPEPVFVNVCKGLQIRAQDSILPVYVAWLAGTTTVFLYFVPRIHRLFLN